MNEGSWGTRESVAASTRCFAGREELIEALELKGWAVFLAEDGNMVVGAPKGSPVPGECQSCSGVEGVRIDGGLLLTGGCAIFVPPAVWGTGRKKNVATFRSIRGRSRRSTASASPWTKSRRRSRPRRSCVRQHGEISRELAGSGGRR